MFNNIPQPTIIRLCTIYQFLFELEKEGVTSISSTELDAKIGVASHTIRKDINYLGEIGNTRGGYDVSRLKNHIAIHLRIGPQQKSCVVGLGHLGQAILQSSSLGGGEFKIVAGFDSNVNKLETIKASVPLFPSYEIADVVRSMGIDLAVIAVPPENARDVAGRLFEGGIKGILNFAPVVIKPGKSGVIVRNIDIGQEFRILSVLARSQNPTIEPATH